MHEDIMLNSIINVKESHLMTFIYQLFGYSMNRFKCEFENI